MSPVQRYRFRVRTADGREITSAIAAVRLPPHLEAPQWSHSEFGPGDRAAMHLGAPGRDGENIHFVVERRSGGGAWESIGHTSGTVEGGRVSVEHEMPEIPHDEGDGHPPAEVEYHDDGQAAAGGSSASSAERREPAGADQGGEDDVSTR
jgi:hypothetical protein